MLYIQLKYKQALKPSDNSTMTWGLGFVHDEKK